MEFMTTGSNNKQDGIESPKMKKNNSVECEER